MKRGQIVHFNHCFWCSLYILEFTATKNCNFTTPKESFIQSKYPTNSQLSFENRFQPAGLSGESMKRWWFAHFRHSSVHEMQMMLRVTWPVCQLHSIHYAHQRCCFSQYIAYFTPEIIFCDTTDRPQHLGQVGSSKSVRVWAESELLRRISVDEHGYVIQKLSEL